MTLFQAEVSLDPLDEPGAELLSSAVHRQRRQPFAPRDGEVSSLPWFKRATLLGQPSLELLARHA